MPEIAIDEIWDFLRAIESGSVTLTPDEAREPQEVYAGNVAYSASNGWKIVVFNDANEWDYIDRIDSNDGRLIVYDEISEFFPDIDGYHPSAEVSWSRYRIPGRKQFRCTICGAQLNKLVALEKHGVVCYQNLTVK